MDRSGRVINPFEIVNEGTYCKPKVPLPSLREQLPEECPPELALKRLAELTAATVAQEASLAALEEEVGALEGEGARLEEELERVESDVDHDPQEEERPVARPAELPDEPRREEEPCRVHSWCCASLTMIWDEKTTTWAW